MEESKSSQLATVKRDIEEVKRKIKRAEDRADNATSDTAREHFWKKEELLMKELEQLREDKARLEGASAAPAAEPIETMPGTILIEYLDRAFSKWLRYMDVQCSKENTVPGEPNVTKLVKERVLGMDMLHRSVDSGSIQDVGRDPTGPRKRRRGQKPSPLFLD